MSLIILMLGILLFLAIIIIAVYLSGGSEATVLKGTIISKRYNATAESYYLVIEARWSENTNLFTQEYIEYYCSFEEFSEYEVNDEINCEAIIVDTKTIIKNIYK